MCQGFTSFYRPSSYTTPGTTNTTFTTPTYAYTNATGAKGVPPDTTNYATQYTTVTSNPGSTGTSIYTGLGTNNGTLYIAMTTTTEDIFSGDGNSEAVSSVVVTYSKDGGTTWNPWFIIQGGGDIVYTSPQTVVISGASGDVQVKITTNSIKSGTGGGLHGASAAAQAQIYDIWIS
jgi:hypothetical protein